MLHPNAVRTPVILSFFTMIALAVLTAGCQPPSPASSTPKSENLVTREPAEGVVFLDAFAQGDDQATDQLASPLYQAEWSRQGLSLPDRLALHREGDRGIQFAFVGGVFSSSGFARYLFLAAPTPGPAKLDKTVSVWRVDLDPTGRVVWAEPVWWFARNATVTTFVREPNLPETHPLDANDASNPTLLVRIQSDTSQEAFNLIRVKKSDPGQGRQSVEILTSLYGTDKEGNFRPSTWSFGQPVAPSRDHKPVLPTSLPHISPAVDELRADYLAFLARETFPGDIRWFASTSPN